MPQVRFLQSLFLFYKWPQRLVTQVALAARVIRLSRHEYLFRTGDEAGSLFFVKSGCLLETQTIEYSTELTRQRAASAVAAVHRRIRLGLGESRSYHATQRATASQRRSLLQQRNQFTFGGSRDDEDTELDGDGDDESTTGADAGDESPSHHGMSTAAKVALAQQRAGGAATARPSVVAGGEGLRDSTSKVQRGLAAVSVVDAATATSAADGRGNTDLLGGLELRRVAEACFSVGGSGREAMPRDVAVPNEDERTIHGRRRARVELALLGALDLAGEQPLLRALRTHRSDMRAETDTVVFEVKVGAAPDISRVVCQLL